MALAASGLEETPAISNAHNIEQQTTQTPNRPSQIPNGIGRCPDHRQPAANPICDALEQLNDARPGLSVQKSVRRRPFRVLRREVRLIADDDHERFLRRDVLKVADPLFDPVQRVGFGFVEDNDRSFRVLVENATDGSIPLLTGRVPDLKADLLRIACPR
jgi:hypothetical protein